MKKNKRIPKVNANYVTNPDPGADESSWNEQDLRGILTNPVYAGVGAPAIVPEEVWIKCASRIIRDEGPEQFCVNLLYLLREMFGGEPL